MNKIDDILEQLKGQQPVIDDPDALTDRIMESLPDFDSNSHTKKVPLWHWLSVAASILLVIGIGTTWIVREAGPKLDRQVAKVENVKVEPKAVESQPVETPVVEPVVAQVAHRKTEIPETPVKPKTPEKLVAPEIPEADPNLHYASQELTKDTVPYQDPARVDEFIVKLATYHKVNEGELTCSSANDSSLVSAVYVFPDTKEIDLFSRLLQVACCYSDETPGYLLNFSHQQFFFELKDMRKQLKYRWIAERINGKILFYGTHAPLDTKESSACYQEYRDELMHTKSINHKTKEI